VRGRKNPAELPASWSNSGAGTEKRPKRCPDSTGRNSSVKQKKKKKSTILYTLLYPGSSRPALTEGELLEGDQTF
jgi:hypothetical protein